MKSSQLISKRYARGLYQASGSDAKKAKSYLEVLAVLKSLFEVEEAQKVLNNPVISHDVKYGILEELLKKYSIDSHMSNFLKTLSEAGRLSALPGIHDEFNTLLMSSEGILRADLITAVDITDHHKKEIKASLEERFKRKIDLDLKVDKSILGGFVVRIGNSIIDLSLKTKLEKIAQVALN